MFARPEEMTNGLCHLASQYDQTLIFVNTGLYYQQIPNQGFYAQRRDDVVGLDTLPVRR